MLKCLTFLLPKGSKFIILLHILALYTSKKKKKVPSSTQGKRQETTQFIMLQEGCCRPLLPVNELSTLKSFNAEATSWIAHLIQLGTQFTSFAIVVGISF